ncbi:hypothetical protein QJQ45_024872, partial [Haematococcus lacustris]
QHLTQLCLKLQEGVVRCLDKFLAALQPLAQLQVLTISPTLDLGGLPRLLQALPQLHTLHLPGATGRGQEDLETLLAATQLTSIQLGSLKDLSSSRADAPCSWQRLELTHWIKYAIAAYLPLHSLTQPLMLCGLSVGMGDDGDADPSLLLAVHNLTQACNVPVRIGDLRLRMCYSRATRQHEELQQLVAVVQALNHCSWAKVTVLFMDVGAADVVTLAPLCQGCTHIEFYDCGVTPSLEFWRQLVQLMPTITNVVFDLAHPPMMPMSPRRIALGFVHSKQTLLGQQTVPAMSQRDMQHQVTVDGGTSAADGYSPAGEAPPPATRLLDLPPALLDDIACRVMQLGARSLLSLTCRAFSQARLLHVPALRIQLGRQCCDQLLTPRVVAALQARTSKLALTLWQPETEDSVRYRKQLAPTLQLLQTEDTQDYTKLLAHALAKLDKCAAVEVCKLVCSGVYYPDARKHLTCPPGLAQQLLDSFPSLTALTLEGLCVSSYALASLLSHPPLALQLQQLHLTDDSVPDGEEPVAVGTVFQGLRLKELSIAAVRPKLQSSEELGSLRLSSFQSLAQHLTQLHLASSADHELPSYLRESLQHLAQLQVLTVSNLHRYLHGLEGLTEVLQALPQLHTLQLPDITVRGQQELDTLLAATQITRLQLDSVEALDTSYAVAPCSWHRLELTWVSEWATIACLPLHSLSQPLVLGRLDISVRDILAPEVAAALHHLAKACKVPVQIKEVRLRWRSPDDLEVITPALLQQQRVDLAQLVALLQPLQCCGVGKVLVYYLRDAAAADVLALAPLCRDCTHFALEGGSVEPSLEFWHQLVQLMPTVQKVDFRDIRECQQTVPAMSQRDMQHQVTVDGGASAADGYSPASEAPPPATRLLDLPPALLEDIACRVMQLGARSLLPLTCRAFSQAPQDEPWMICDEQEVVGPSLEGLQLKQLSIDVRIPNGTPLLPSFQPLAQHLTQLTLIMSAWHVDTELGYYIEYLQPLAQLQVLTISYLDGLEGLTEVLQALPQLHTLQLPRTMINGQQQLETLLAATQITSLQLEGVRWLHASCADAPCSWQRLELTGDIEGPEISDIPDIQYLPLHSLSQPLVLGKFDISVDLIPYPEVAVALHLVSQACKVPVQNKEVQLSMLSQEQQETGPGVITAAFLQQQRVDLAQLVALLQPLQCCGKVEVHDLHEVTATDVLALAPLCRDCTHFVLHGGSIEPSLEFWRQLVQLMPAVQQVTFICVEGCVSAAMHQSLQLMAEQPWARWLQVTLRKANSVELHACWQAGSWLKTGSITRDMQHQVAVDGGASADGYSPASEAPPPATRLLDLPPALLDDIACQSLQLGPRSQLALTCRAFSQARLLHVPALRIQLGRKCCDQLLTPRAVAALQMRTSKLALTLWQPETEDCNWHIKQYAPTLQLPQTEYTQDYIDLLVHALAKLDNCAAVEVCTLVSSGLYPYDKLKYLHCPPGLAQQLLGSFPSLTALTLEGLCVSNDDLASLLSHPPLALQLQQLHLTNISDSDELGALGLTSLQGLQLKQLSIEAIRPKQPGTPPLPSFQPLAQHLTQLHLVIGCAFITDLSFFKEYLQPLAQLQVLTISQLYSLNGLTEVLLQALPQLHTLQLPFISIRGQQLDALLAATQVTSLELAVVEALRTSYADAPCSWQRLKLTALFNSSGIAYLPLHSLSQPLVLGRLAISVDNIPDPAVAAALHLAEAIKVPVQLTQLDLTLRSHEQRHQAISSALLQQQRMDLAQLVALLRPLQCCFVGKVQVFYLDEVTAADVVALAPLCRDCTYIQLCHGNIDPSLEFWRQLVQLMPAVQEISFYRVKGCVSAAMHESLQLMAEQPWARWLHVTFRNDFTASELHSCWQAGSWLKTGIFKVTMLHVAF